MCVRLLKMPMASVRGSMRSSSALQGREDAAESAVLLARMMDTRVSTSASPTTAPTVPVMSGECVGVRTVRMRCVCADIMLRRLDDEAGGAVPQVTSRARIDPHVCYACMRSLHLRQVESAVLRA